VDQRIEIPEQAQSISVYITTSEGDDVTREMIENPDYQFLFITWDINKAPVMAFEKINILNQYFSDKGIELAGLTSNSIKEIEPLVEMHSLDFIFYNADNIALKTVVRANPGLILLKEGRVINKWHYHDFPTIAELEMELELN